MDRSDAKVVIVGAGAAGLTAAYFLNKNGFKNVVVLEARNRIGGRIHTLTVGDYELSMGAEYLHINDKKANLALEFLHEHGVDDYDINEAENIDYNIQTFSLPKTHEETLKIFWENMISVYNDCGALTKEEKEVLMRNEDSSTQLSLGSLLKSKFHEIFNSSHLMENEERMMKSLLDVFLRIVSDNEGDDVFKITTKLMGLPSCESIEDKIILPKNGYKELIQYLADGINRNWIKLNDPVSKINYQGIIDSSNGLMEVSTESGKIYKADHVLVTLPTGVLKERQSSMFEPMLPYRKRKAIELINSGSFMKIFFKFDSDDGICAQNGDFYFYPVWLDKGVYLDEDFRKINNNTPEIKKFWNRFITQMKRTKNGLWTAYLFGEGAVCAENLSPDDIEEGIFECLQTTLRSVDCPGKPTFVHKSSWISDEYSKGSYSSSSTACDEECLWMGDIATPVVDAEKKPRLMFAGEGTSTAAVATVHGAMETAKAEVDRLISLYSSSKELTAATSN